MCVVCLLKRERYPVCAVDYGHIRVNDYSGSAEKRRMVVNNSA